MDEDIKNFHKQFEYEPVIENEANLERADSFIVCGMGGSHLASGLLKIADPYLDMIIHKDYGLPTVSDEKLKNLVNKFARNMRISKGQLNALLSSQKEIRKK